jgi:hypothetical protein
MVVLGHIMDMPGIYLLQILVVGLPVKEETFWIDGESFSLLMSDPTDGLFLEFF